MKLITRRQRAARAAEAWSRQYGNPPASKAKRTIYYCLNELGSNPDPDQVDEIIGNGTWTDCRCTECEKKFDAVVELGEEPDYDSATVTLCLDCLKSAISLARTAKQA